MAVVLRQIQPSFDQAGATGGIDQPGGNRPDLVSFMLIIDLVRARARVRQRKRAYYGGVEKADAAAARQFAQVVLKNSAVNLVTWSFKVSAGAQFEYLVHILTRFGKEKSEAELLKLARRQMFFQAEDRIEIVGGDFNRGFTHLVRGFRNRVWAAFDHQNVEIGKALVQMQCQRKSGQAAAHDDDVVLIGFHFSGFPLPIRRLVCQRLVRCRHRAQVVGPVQR